MKALVLLVGAGCATLPPVDPNAGRARWEASALCNCITALPSPAMCAARQSCCDRYPQGVDMFELCRRPCP